MSYNNEQYIRHLRLTEQQISELKAHNSKGRNFSWHITKPKTTPKNEVTQNRTYLYTSYKDADAMQELKKAGVVSFDIRHKVWYLKDDTQADKVKQWTHRPYVPTPEEAFVNHLKPVELMLPQDTPLWTVDRTA
ncbi:hypothetical protein I6G26_00415 (plasmid) [Moraxella nonliquefaciens]|uniref:Uncharacterized protein n=1 Tax=Moraxella nonliquefaciens TaxID=478 RepID=A0A7T3EYT0_MORNO|nr:hypothetical protein [Moraxella nonliquefaciens]QPT43588.1 hypothetical protein I6G26_00415 [Moraxella nonliquefaciens]